MITTEVFVAGRGGGKTTYLLREVVKALMLEEVVAVVVPNQHLADEWRKLLRQRGIPVLQHTSQVPMGLAPRTLHILTPNSTLVNVGLADYKDPAVFVDNIDLMPTKDIYAIGYLNPRLVTCTKHTFGSSWWAESDPLPLDASDHEGVW